MVPPMSADADDAVPTIDRQAIADSLVTLIGIVNSADPAERESRCRSYRIRKSTGTARRWSRLAPPILPAARRS